ncbi:unnamed protein product [Gongylonema pulchrum]|uniref:ZP domain-containing protein n=1 Tax=Gongylonema pulchrum TaxID=637853 RepID=A0A183D7W5_9BILA|nr:unnamed protein product [Gongylonema pulchrum]
MPGTTTTYRRDGAHLFYYILTVLLATPWLLAIPLDNGIIGEPELECGPVSIALTFATLNSFHGHVYVKGRFEEPGCRSDGTGEKSAGLTLPFSTCGILRERSLSPRGIFASATIIITFHPYFLTKVDRAFNVKCFYMEADKVYHHTISTFIPAGNNNSNNINMATVIMTLTTPMSW